MQRRWITLLIAIAALAAYGFGFEHSAWGLVAGGAALELWFWLRLLSQGMDPLRRMG